MGPRTLAATLLSLAHLASSQPDITRAADWRWNKASYVDKNGAPASTAGRTSLVPFGIWGTARQGWQLARAWQGGFVPMPNYAAQGTMALMRHVASKQHPEALAAPAPHPFYNIGAQVGSRSLEKTSYRIFNLALSMGAIGAFALAKEVSPHMIKRGKGTIIYTSATAAYRGNAGQHAHTAAMA